MPGFSNSLSTTELWQLTLLLANADKLPASALAALAAAPESKSSTPMAPAPVRQPTQ
jgi:hypothetical protein